MAKLFQGSHIFQFNQKSRPKNCSKLVWPKNLLNLTAIYKFSHWLITSSTKVFSTGFTWSRRIFFMHHKVEIHWRSNVIWSDLKQSQIVAKSAKANMISCQNLSTVPIVWPSGLTYNRIMQRFPQLLCSFLPNISGSFGPNSVTLFGQPFF